MAKRIAAFSNPNFSKNVSKTEALGFAPCPCCGRAVKETVGQAFLEVVFFKGESGSFFRTSLTESVSESQGWFPVGPTCLRKLKGALVGRLAESGDIVAQGAS